jgi:superfamily II DNA or RNA helicase
MAERKHQQLIRKRFEELSAGLISDHSTTLDACPGGGKSRCVTIAIEELRGKNLHAGLIWLVPRASLAAQSRKAFNAAMSPLRLETVKTQSGNGFGPAPFGYVSTYQRFTSKRAQEYANTVAKNLGKRKGIVLIALDELHHCTADEAQAWTNGVRALERALRKVNAKLHFLNMSGTLFRKDQQPILNVIYKDGRPVTHISYGLKTGRSEKAVIPPEFVFVDGKVTIRSKTQREAVYESMADVPQSHRPKLVKAFLGGQTNREIERGHDSRELTSLWMLRYGIEHLIEQRKKFNDYPLQTIVVAHSAAAAVGYTGWLRQQFPELRTAVSLSNNEPCDWGHAGFKGVKFPYPIIIDHNGKEHSVSSSINVMGSESEQASIWTEDFQSILHGVPAANYDLNLTDPELRGTNAEWKELPIGEKVIRAFQSPPVNGENIIDVLVTVGKAYEGLDAPRCSHLICLARHRSAPWLAQCFARAWRYDYDLAATGVVDQRCWIFAPRDSDMLDAVQRIVWEEPLCGVYQPREEDDETAGDAVPVIDELQPTPENQRCSPEELEIEWARAEAQRVKEAEYEEFACEFGEQGTDDDDEVDDSDDDESDPAKPAGIVRAFNVIERVIHQFVDDSLDQFAVIKEEEVNHAITV